METIKLQEKTVYVTDWCYAEEAIFEEMRAIQRTLSLRYGLEIDLKEYQHVPKLDYSYSIVFFDFGGVLNVCFTEVDNYTRTILKFAEDNPNTFIVVTSTFSRYLRLVDDLIEEYFGESKLKNIFTDINSFGEFYKKYKEINCALQ